jgi:aminoglycoside/choline kinase family phosphotransferase
MTNLFSNCPPNMSDFSSLLEWAETFLPDDVLLQAEKKGEQRKNLMLAPLNGDAGFRQYFRLNTEPSLIAVSAPPEYENNPAFVNISLCFQANGIRTPVIYAVDYQQGFLLLEDFGDQLLLPKLSSESVDELYGAAESVLLQIQQIDSNTDIFPCYGATRLLDEMALFPQWFVEQLLELSLQPDDREILDNTFALLVENALEQPQVVVHRDYHARNLMWLADDSLGVIDFQDAVMGPFSYDLVSLLRDCYIRWPQRYVDQRALAYYRRATNLGRFPSVPEAQVKRWFDLMGLQRHIKVLGIFARLWLRDGKCGYLDDLPLVIRYTLEQLEPYPELHLFKDWFERRVLPQLPKQSWYKPWQTAGDR